MRKYGYGLESSPGDMVWIFYQYLHIHISIYRGMGYFGHRRGYRIQAPTQGWAIEIQLGLASSQDEAQAVPLAVEGLNPSSEAVEIIRLCTARPSS